MEIEREDILDYVIKWAIKSVDADEKIFDEVKARIINFEPSKTIIPFEIKVVTDPEELEQLKKDRDPKSIKMITCCAMMLYDEEMYWANVKY